MAGGNAEANTALLMAVRGKDVEAVRNLLSKGADPNTFCPTNGRSVLSESLIMSIVNGEQLAISEEYNNIAKLLIAEGADVNSKSKMYKMTPLMIVVHFGRLYHCNEQIKMLAEAGADLDCQDTDGNTALMIAAEDYYDSRAAKTNQRCEVALKTLLDLGANPNIMNKDGPIKW